jgi:uncharacterized membrane protein YhaH (DUF805 family)
MSIDGPRFAAFLAFTERGFTPDDAGACVMALHPLDDAPIPGRSFEKAVRARSRVFAKDARRATAATALRLAHEALTEYRGLAFQFGEGYYQTRYDPYLPSQTAQPPSGPTVRPTSAVLPGQVVPNTADPATAWWGAPAEPSPPPPPAGAVPAVADEGFNAAWNYSAPKRSQSPSVSPYSGSAPKSPSVVSQVGMPQGNVGGAAPARSFTEAIAFCLRNYATFEGRASRSEYWYFVLFHFLAVFASTFVAIALLPPGVGDAFGVFVQIALMLPSIAVSVRRMHDVDLSGWFVLVPIYSIVLLASRGTDGPNRFG